jgi:hypothetical protein
MKHFSSALLLFVLTGISSFGFAQSNLVITGIMDGPLPGGLPKGLELYVVNDIADLSVYGLANANNGNPSVGAPIYTFPAGPAAAGTYIYCASEDAGFPDFNGFAADYNVGSVMNVNGDDVVELYQNGAVVDLVGEIGVDGTGTAWDYLDGWAYRVSGTGPSATFSTAEWTFSGIDVFDGETSNATAANPWPLGTYTADFSGPASVSFAVSAAIVSEASPEITLSVSILNPSEEVATTVDVVVLGGTAVNGEHYTFVGPTTLTFEAGSGDAQTVTVVIIDDVDQNEDRTIEFGLENPSGETAIGTAMLTLTIEDNDAVVVLEPIGDAAATDANGVAVNLGAVKAVEGTVHGVNMRTSGLSFTIIDETGGVGIFSPSTTFDYTVTEGDNVIVVGEVGQFNGLTQLQNIESIALVSQDNMLMDAQVVTAFSEATESQLINLACVSIVDPSQWTGAGSGFNVTVTDGENEFAMRIVNTVELYAQPAPTGEFSLTGIGGQFDNQTPFLEGYQIFPRYAADIAACVVSASAGAQIEGLEVFPNPASSILRITADQAFDELRLFNLLGQSVKEVKGNSVQRTELDLGGLRQGVYILQVGSAGQYSSTKVVIE